MPAKTPPASTPVSALHEILKWSSNRPDWQRDALRRIVTQDALAEADLIQLDRLCRSKHQADFSSDPPVISDPLSDVHLPPAPGSESSVTLLSIGNLQRVNRLPTDQSLTFGDNAGLTVIYGDNGSGKSGYVRVIKKACRTRGTLPVIRPNAFAPSTAVPAVPASADIVCRVAGTTATFSWNDGAVSDGRLANVFVFDDSTADHYLEEDAPASFSPSGLDILPKLSKICDLITARIQTDIDAIKAEITLHAKNWKTTSSTVVGILIDQLSPETKKSDVEALATPSAKQSQRLTELKEALKSDPKQKARETKASATRLRSFALKIVASNKELSDAPLLALRKLIEDAVATAEVAKSFAGGQFDTSYLSGTGSALWRGLWEAARLFSTSEAYKDQAFPLMTVDEDRCLLCQELVTIDARERFQAFDTFCKDQSQKLSAEATRRLSEASAKIAPLDLLATAMSHVEADISSWAQDQKDQLKAYIVAADKRLAAVKKNLHSKTWNELSALPQCPAIAIQELATALDTRAIMEESADNPDARSKLSAEHDELAAKEWLISAKEEVLSQIDRYKRISILEHSQKDATTRAVTEKSTALAKHMVTDTYCKRFELEVKQLGLRTITVKLENIKGRKGETRFGLRLDASSDSKVNEIASEGEKRCIALAAFLAELSQASHNSALVFDDPVSSLDHWHRDRIAERLVQESRTRQVVVFTHDAVFLNDLQTHSQEQSVTTLFRYVEWHGSNPGCCNEGLPWDCKSPEDRLDKLEKQQREIAKVWQPQPNQSNIADMRSAYSWLRATLERIVERVVFADVVFRFRSYVKLKDLQDVVGFSDTECAELKRLHKRCCDFTDAHDSPSGKQASIPTPAELSKDITETKTLLAAIRFRAKTKKATSAPAGGPAGTGS